MFGNFFALHGVGSILYNRCRNSIGQAIARRVGTGKHVVLGDLKLEAAQAAAQIFEGAGFETSTITVDISSRESILTFLSENSPASIGGGMNRAFVDARKCN